MEENCRSRIQKQTKVMREKSQQRNPRMNILSDGCISAALPVDEVRLQLPRICEAPAAHVQHAKL
jgi:hypothetical protein